MIKYICSVLWGIGHILSSVFFGCLISLVLMGVLCLLPRLVVMRYRWEITGIGALVVFVLFAWFQATLLVGGIKVKGVVPTTQEIEQLVKALPAGINASSPLDASQWAAIEQEIEKQFPLVTPFLGSVRKELEGIRQGGMQQGGIQLARFSRQIHRAINYYILRRILWLLGGLLVVGVFLGHDATRQGRQQQRRMQMDYFT